MVESKSWNNKIKIFGWEFSFGTVLQAKYKAKNSILN